MAAFGLALYPRFLGAIFNNSKDMPLAVAMLVVLWLVLRLVNGWPRRRSRLIYSALIGVAIGAAAAIRINALVWYGVLGLVAAHDGGCGTAAPRQGTAPGVRRSARRRSAARSSV